MLAVILPSKNEEDNISYITEVIDSGIRTYFDPTKSLILNVDSSSEDNTTTAFMRTYTQTPKKSMLMTDDKLGKGYNIKAAINFALEKGYNTFLSLDSDVRSIEPFWIQKFLTELSENKSDFVLPLYKRNKFEGNTTNHFSSPLIYACWNLDIKQPIAGDFGFNLDAAKLISKSENFLSDNKYGIDTLMTWAAIGNNLKISQIDLGKKIHSPSFSKIVGMFREVCSSTFNQVVKYKDVIKENLLSAPSNISPFVHMDSSYTQHPNREAVSNLERLSQKMLQNVGLSLDVKEVGCQEWTDGLSQFISDLLNSEELSPVEISNAVDKTSALYLARVCNFINEASEMSDEAVSSDLDGQKYMLASKMRQRVTSPISLI